MGGRGRGFTTRGCVRRTGMPRRVLRAPRVLKGVLNEGVTCRDWGCFQGLLCGDEGGAVGCARLCMRSVLAHAWVQNVPLDSSLSSDEKR